MSDVSTEEVADGNDADLAAAAAAAEVADAGADAIVDTAADAIVETPAPLLPGRLLREAREARGLSVFEVAQSLKFSPRQIETLEADHYEALPPGTTFLRGFVRGYAKLLKLDPASMLALLDVKAPAAPPDVREPGNMGVAASPVVTGRRSSLPMMVGAAALAVLAAGLGVWHFLGDSAPAPAPAADTAAVRPPEIRIEETPAAAPGGAVPLPADARQLVFVFHDKSWVEVMDAAQHVILSGENAAGTRQAVSGRPPFQVVIGNANKVELQYGDQMVDLKPHIRAEVARLTLE